MDKNKTEYLPPYTGKKPIGCLNCGGTYSKLPMRTRLYNDFGGYRITKNSELFFMEKVNTPFHKCKTLSWVERRAKLEPDADWRCIMDLPLRGGTYQQQGKSKWVLVEVNNGFA